MNSMLSTLREFGLTFRDWLIENQRNPILWIGLFLLGLLIFALAYNALQKEK